MLSSSDGKALTSDGNSVMALKLKQKKADHEHKLCVLYVLSCLIKESKNYLFIFIKAR